MPDVTNLKMISRSLAHRIIEKKFEIGDYDCVKEELEVYLRDAVLFCAQMELWSIWLDDPDTDIQRRTCRADELSEDDITWIWGQKCFEHPQCLKLYKWRRGKK